MATETVPENVPAFKAWNNNVNDAFVLHPEIVDRIACIDVASARLGQAIDLTTELQCEAAENSNPLASRLWTIEALLFQCRAAFHASLDRPHDERRK